MNSRLFLHDCPEGCPPADAVDANGDVYRLVHENPPTPTDFDTFAEKGERPNGDGCLRCGLSVFPTQRAAGELYRYMQRRHPNGTRLGHYIARLELTPTDGRIKPTGRPPHLTWWMYRDTVREATYRQTVENLHNAVAD